VALIVKFSRSLNAKLNPQHSFRTRLGLTIFGTAVVLAILASVIFSDIASKQFNFYVGQPLAESAYQITDELDWRILEIYTESAVRLWQQLQQRIFTWNTMFGVSCAVFGWLIGVTMTYQTVALTVIIDHIRQGKELVKIPKLLGKDKIARLSQVFSQVSSNFTTQKIDQKTSQNQRSPEPTAQLMLQEMLCQSEKTCHQLVEKIQMERKQAEETRLALEKERELSKLKSQFIALTSHEFRTPLTSILLSCEFLREHNHKLSEEAKHKYFNIIKSSVKHLDHILEDVLLISRTQAGKVQFNPTPLALANFCFNLLEQLQAVAGEQYNISFISQCSYNSTAKDLPLMDEKLLRCILTNLLSNAIKYSPEGGNIQFELICDLESVIFRIQDHGIGIPKEEQAMLFTTFYRCSNTGNLPGTGLGLTIVKNAVDLHGGQITVDSEVGLGTTFTVQLPLNHQ
jgi:signal transduction histidine kinase